MWIVYNRMITDLLRQLQRGEDLTNQQTEAALEAMLAGDVQPIQAAALLFGLSLKGETADEVLGLLRSVRQHMQSIDLGVPVLDTCGTGGDGKGTLNLSTAAALVCAGLGVPVAKHGNRAVSSACGSADLLEALGVPISLTGQAAKEYFQRTNFIFMFAPLYHPAFKQLAEVRRQLGVRTIINLLGPLANPANAAYRLVGVADERQADLVGQTLMELGVQRVIVVHSDDGLDEVSIAAPTTVYEFTPNDRKRSYFEPATKFSLEEITGASAKDNAAVIRALADGEASGAVITAVAVNAGLALYAAGRVPSQAAGQTLAQQYLRSNKLADYLNKLSFTPWTYLKKLFNHSNHCWLKRSNVYH